MTEPTASYEGLMEECTTDFLVRRVVVPLLILSSLCGQGDATFPTTAASVDHKDVNMTRTLPNPIMLNDRSVPADDIQDFSSSSDSYYSSSDNDYSLPLTVEVEEDDDDDDDICSDNQYLDLSLNACMNCTICGPGMQHKIDQKCGYGNGFEQICEQCPDGRYQDRSSYILARCQPCITCDKLADTIQECSPVHNAQCGPCPSGMYYYLSNLCFDCDEGGSDREECRTTKPTPPVLTTSTPSPSPMTTHAAAFEIIVTSSNINVTSSNGTERPPAEHTVHGGKKVIGAVVGGFVVVVPSSLVAFCLFKYLKRRRRRSQEADTPEKTAENGSNCDDPGVKSVKVLFNVQNETIGYVPVSQQELSQHGNDLSLPQTLRSDLPFDNSPMFPICSCNRPVALGQDAPPARLPAEDEAVPL